MTQEEQQKKDEQYMRKTLIEAEQAYAEGEIPVGAMSHVRRCYRLGADTENSFWCHRRKAWLPFIRSKCAPSQGTGRFRHP